MKNLVLFIPRLVCFAVVSVVGVCFAGVVFKYVGTIIVSISGWWSFGALVVFLTVCYGRGKGKQDKIDEQLEVLRVRELKK